MPNSRQVQYDPSKRREGRTRRTTSNLQSFWRKKELRVRRKRDRIEVYPIRSRHGTLYLEPLDRKNKDPGEMAERCLHGVHTATSNGMDQHHGQGHGQRQRLPRFGLQTGNEPKNRPKRSGRHGTTILVPLSRT
jgi:hypothetical protein